ncbi:Uncharacterised protein [Elizabethkingia meningoseptica]|nr:Uncharacterised protein [Elizabethkingia meningoseptica]
MFCRKRIISKFAIYKKGNGALPYPTAFKKLMTPD